MTGFYFTPAATSTRIFDPPPAQDGWRCPTCGAIMAPWMPTCVNKHEAPRVTISTTTNFPPNGTGDTTPDVAYVAGEVARPSAVWRHRARRPGHSVIELAEGGSARR